MNIEEAKDLRLGKAEGVEDRARFEINLGPKFDDELHAQRPLADFIARGSSQPSVEVVTDRPDRPISDDRERRAYIHSGSEAGLRFSLAVHTLIEQAHTQDLAVLDQCLVHRHPRPDLHRAARHQLRAYPLVELADGKYKPIFFVKETRRVGQFECIVSNA